MQLIVDVAAVEVPGADCAGFTTINQSGASTPVFTDLLVRRVDAVQHPRPTRDQATR